MLKTKHALLTTFVFAAAISGCSSKGGGQNGSPAPEAPAPTATPDPSTATPGTAATPATPAFNSALSSEYSALPPAVAISTNLDAGGNPIPGTAQLRVLTGTTSGLTDYGSVASAFATGTPVTTAAPSGELDRDTSAQSWGNYQSVGNYANYQPQYHSSQQSGFSYSYGSPQSYMQNGHAYYVYQRPSCTPIYCAPNTTYTPAAPVGPGPGGPAPVDYDSLLKQAFTTYGVYALQDTEWPAQNQAKTELGGRLFYDTILSANNDLACSSCHVESQGTTSVYSLQPTGTVLAGRKRGPLSPSDLLPRKVPALFNLGHPAFATMFWDSRVSRDPSTNSSYITPAGIQTPTGLDSALAAQALFPIIGPTEMGCGLVASDVSPNGAAVNQAPLTQQPSYLWGQVMQRVLSRPDYQQMLAAAYPEANGQFTIADVANAIAAFEGARWKADNSPFDRYVRGDLSALSPQQKEGAAYFYGKGGCAECHSGPFQTDHGRHATAVPQFGPGAGDGLGSVEDYGVGRISGAASDRYKFRTPSLRNVQVVGPWGHDGAFTSLRQFVEHYNNPQAALTGWNPSQVILAQGYYLNNQMLGAWLNQAALANLQNADELKPSGLSEEEVDAVMEFLLSLTDDSVAHNDHTITSNQ